MVVAGGGGLWECPVREATEGAYGDARRHRARGGLLSLALALLLGPDERFGPLREGRVRWWRLLVCVCECEAFIGTLCNLSVHTCDFFLTTLIC